jgi:hypothetical protein
MQMTCPWIVLFLFAVPCASDMYMVVEYDTDGNARPVGVNFTLHTVELYVTLLGCDHGYYAESVHPLVCKECVCVDFAEGRVEAFVEELGI